MSEAHYFQDATGGIYKAEKRRNAADSHLPFVNTEEVEHHMSKDFAGNVVDTQHRAPYDSAAFTVTNEALKYNPAYNTLNLSRSVQDQLLVQQFQREEARSKRAEHMAVTTADSSGSAVAGTTGVQSTTTAAASGNTKVSTSKS